MIPKIKNLVELIFWSTKLISELSQTLDTFLESIDALATQNYFILALKAP